MKSHIVVTVVVVDAGCQVNNKRTNVCNARNSRKLMLKIENKKKINEKTREKRQQTTN